MQSMEDFMHTTGLSCDILYKCKKSKNILVNGNCKVKHVLFAAENSGK